LETILSFHKSFTIPFSQINEISDTLLPYAWKEIRASGTDIAGLIRAGTFYAFRDKEFWILKRKNNTIRIELNNNNNKFKRVMLGIKDDEKRTMIIKKMR
jgi:hypothetical protein